ncbi:unnamed protein product [Cuscuta campestris]|uniref:DUF4283 domain-containing protein n=1 Tax=Cuscuta campestris TaxID=132261 RepID=A0A484ML62_9ASTE|nr:unnamed protein product [Cuscuta campestris]
MHRVVKHKINGKKPTVLFNDKGQPYGVAAAEMQCYIGVLARTKAPIWFDTWRQVPVTIKNKIWKFVTLGFDLPSSAQKLVLQSANSKWKQFKSTLTFHDEHVKRVKENKYPHRLSRKGYANLEQEWAKTHSGDESVIDRSVTWVLARKDKEGNFKSDSTKQKAEEIEFLREQVCSGVLTEEGDDDVLTKALGKPEHGGRVRGQGMHVRKAVYFNLPRSKKQKTQTTVDEQVKEGVRELLAEEGENGGQFHSRLLFTFFSNVSWLLPLIPPAAMSSGKAQSGKKIKRKVPRSPKKNGAKEDATKVSSLATDIAMQALEEERAQTASSSSATSPPFVEVVPERAPQVGKTTAQNTPQVLDNMPEPEKAAAKPVTFADLFKGNRDPDQGMTLKHYDFGEGVLHIPDSVIKPVEELWGFCLVGCFTGRFPGLKAVDAIVKSWNVPCKINPHCKGWVILEFETDSDRMAVLGRERDKAYGKEFRLKIPSHGFMFDFAEFTTLPVWVQLHNVPLQLWSEEAIGMLASKVGKPLRTDLVTKQHGKGGFCRVLVEVDFSKRPVTHFEVSCMGKSYTQKVEFEEDPKYCYHCKTWNHGPYHCRALELKAKQDQAELEAKQDHAELEAKHNEATDKPNEHKGHLGKGDLHSVQVLMDALDHFSRVSGLTLNPTKSNIFLAGKYRDSSHALLALASFPRGQLPVRYLGLPLASQRISEKDFAPLFKTVEGYLSKWSTLKLSYAGRLELVRAVIQGVQSFWLQVFPVQKYVLDCITSLCRNFLWGSKLAKVAWVDICKPKTEGGLGLKDITSWNNALLCKLLWNLAAKKDSLWVKWVHNIYIQGSDVWQWQPKKRNSVFLKRLAHVRELLVQKLADCNSNMDMAMQPYCSADGLTNTVASWFNPDEIEEDDKLKYKKANYCRVLINMDLSKTPPLNVPVKFVGGSYNQKVEYEDMPQYCHHCRCFGHDPFNCKVLHEINKKRFSEEQKAKEKARVETLKTIMLTEAKAAAETDNQVKTGKNTEKTDGKEGKENQDKGKGILVGDDGGGNEKIDPNDPSPSFTVFVDKDGFTQGNKWAKLDRVLVNYEWDLLNWDCWAEFKDMEPQSDHCPVVLNLTSPNYQGSKSFKFFNMWLKNERFDDVLTEIWSKRVEGTRQYRLCRKLKLLKQPLKEINRAEYGHISLKALDARNKYRNIMSKLVLDPNNQTLITESEVIRKRANFLQDAEKSFFQKKTKCELLIEGDKCSKFFHNLMKKKTASNGIPFLVTDQGNLTQSLESIAKEFIHYFTQLFGSTAPIQQLDWGVFSEGPSLATMDATQLTKEVEIQEKSNIYLAGQIKGNIQLLLNLVNFPQGRLPVKYLGLPLTSQRATERDFAPLVDIVDANIRRWNTKTLSFAGRSELIKTVIQDHSFGAVNFIKWLGMTSVNLRRKEAWVSETLLLGIRLCWPKIFGTLPPTRKHFGYSGFIQSTSKGEVSRLGSPKRGIHTSSKNLLRRHGQHGDVGKLGKLASMSTIHHIWKLRNAVYFDSKAVNKEATICQIKLACGLVMLTLGDGWLETKLMLDVCPPWTNLHQLFWVLVWAGILTMIPVTNHSSEWPGYMAGVHQIPQAAWDWLEELPDDCMAVVTDCVYHGASNQPCVVEESTTLRRDLGSLLTGFTRNLLFVHRLDYAMGHNKKNKKNKGTKKTTQNSTNFVFDGTPISEAKKRGAVGPGRGKHTASNTGLNSASSSVDLSVTLNSFDTLSIEEMSLSPTRKREDKDTATSTLPQTKTNNPIITSLDTSFHLVDNCSPSEGISLDKVEVGEEVTIPAEGFTSLEEDWGFCLVGCFTGRFPSIKAIEDLMSSWNVQCKLLPHEQGWVIFQFLSDEDRRTVLRNGPYMLFRKTLLLHILPEGFRINFDAFMTVDVWVKFVNVPLQCWNKVAFDCLGSRVGTPVRTDQGTKSRGRVSFCRMLIRVDMSKELPLSFVVNLPDGDKYTQRVVYEGLPKYCYHCKKFGHNLLNCRVLRALHHRKLGDFTPKTSHHFTTKKLPSKEGETPANTYSSRGQTSGETSKRARRRRARHKTVIGDGSEAPGSNTALPKPVAKAPLSKQLDSVDVPKVVDEGMSRLIPANTVPETKQKLKKITKANVDSGDGNKGLDSDAGAPKPVPKPAPKPPTSRQTEDHDGADLHGGKASQRVTPAAATEPIEAMKPKKHKTAKMGGNAPTLKVVDGKKTSLPGEPSVSKPCDQIGNITAVPKEKSVHEGQATTTLETKDDKGKPKRVKDKKPSEPVAAVETHNDTTSSSSSGEAKSPWRVAQDKQKEEWIDRLLKAAMLRVDRNDTKRPKLAPDLLKKKIEKNPSTLLDAYGDVLSTKEYMKVVNAMRASNT